VITESSPYVTEEGSANRFFSARFLIATSNVLRLYPRAFLMFVLFALFGKPALKYCRHTATTIFSRRVILLVFAKDLGTLQLLLIMLLKNNVLPFGASTHLLGRTSISLLSICRWKAAFLKDTNTFFNRSLDPPKGRYFFGFSPRVRTRY